MERNYIVPFCLVTSLFFVRRCCLYPFPPSHFFDRCSRLNSETKPSPFPSSTGLGICLRTARRPQQALPERVSKATSSSSSYRKEDLTSLLFCAFLSLDITRLQSTGLQIAYFGIGYFCFSPVAGQVLKRFGYKKVSGNERGGASKFEGERRVERASS